MNGLIGLYILLKNLFMFLNYNGLFYSSIVVVFFYGIQTRVKIVDQLRVVDGREVLLGKCVCEDTVLFFYHWLVFCLIY